MLIKVVPPADSPYLPIQPTAGCRWRITRRLSFLVPAAMNAVVVRAFTSVTAARPADWLRWPVIAVLVAAIFLLFAADLVLLLMFDTSSEGAG